MSKVFEIDSRNYSFADNSEVLTLSETGIHAYTINKIPTTSPYNANAGGPLFQLDAPKRFEFEIVGGAGNPYDGLILPSTVNSDLTDLGTSAFSIVTAFRMRDFHTSASNAGMLMFCQGVSADLGNWTLSTLETSGSSFRLRFLTTNAAGSISRITILDEILEPDIWWVASFNFNGSTYFWHLDTVEIAETVSSTGIIGPGTRTSVQSAVGISTASATSMDGDLGHLSIHKPDLSTAALRTLECDLMAYFKNQPCETEPGSRRYCESIDTEAN